MTPNPATNTANKAQIEKEKEKEGVTNATRHSRLPGTSLGEKKKRQVSIPTSTSPTLSMKIRRLTTQRSRLLQTSAPATAVSPPPRLRARLLCQTQKSPQRYVSSCSLPSAKPPLPPILHRHVSAAANPHRTSRSRPLRTLGSIVLCGTVGVLVLVEICVP
jgi:hypothetical protein